MSDNKVEFRLKEGVEPFNLVLTHLLRIEEKQLRTEMLLQRLLQYKMGDEELKEFLDSVDITAEQLKMELTIEMYAKYGT